MAPGAVEEAGKVANSVVSALGSRPMTLAMIMTNFALIIFLFYSQSQFYQQRQESVKIFLEQQQQVQLLLSKCIVPEGR